MNIFYEQMLNKRTSRRLTGRKRRNISFFFSLERGGMPLEIISQHHVTKNREKGKEKRRRREKECVCVYCWQVILYLFYLTESIAIIFKVKDKKKVVHNGWYYIRYS